MLQNVYQQIYSNDSRLCIKVYNPEIGFSLSQSAKLDDDMCHKLFSTISLLLFYFGSATAADLFQLTVNGQTRSYSSVDELPDFNTMQQQFSVGD